MGNYNFAYISSEFSWTTLAVFILVGCAPMRANSVWQVRAVCFSIKMIVQYLICGKKTRTIHKSIFYTRTFFQIRWKTRANSPIKLRPNVNAVTRNTHSHSRSSFDGWRYKLLFDYQYYCQHSSIARKKRCHFTIIIIGILKYMHCVHSFNQYFS